MNQHELMCIIWDIFFHFQWIEMPHTDMLPIEGEGVDFSTEERDVDQGYDVIY